VAATVITSPFRQLASDGSVVEDHTEPSVQRVQLELVRQDAGWLIRAVYETRRSDDPRAAAGRD
jgi:hypothetical protein